ncbi:hypothetical protein GF325_00685, partial [Candidatus Bathyarchaeota archaeon]|nr:hypothetical protein [Candidatus Bathyarchaeota archaeon]
DVPFEQAAGRIIDLREKLKQRSLTNIFLLMNGCDHLRPEEKIPDFIEFFNKMNDGTEGFLVHVSMEEYITMLKDCIKAFKDEATGETKDVRLKEYTGDLRHGREHPILSDIFSSRVYLIQENVAMQRLLERLVEPLTAIATCLAPTTYTISREYIWYPWRLVLQNHPHDSIGGCSIDEVHADMMHRNKVAREAANQLCKDAVRHVIPRVDLHPGLGEPASGMDTFELLVFNPSAYSRNGIINFWVETQDFGDNTCPEIFKIVDSNGNEVRSRNWRVDQPPLTPSKRKHGSAYYQFEFTAKNVPALGFTTFHAIASEELLGKQNDISWASFEDHNTVKLQSARYQVELNPNGSFNLRVMESGIMYKNLCTFIDEADAGDEYDFHSLIEDLPVTTSNCKCSSVDHGITRDRAWLAWRLSLPVPTSLTDDRLARSKTVVPIDIEITLEMFPCSPRVDISLAINNTARDHRLRVSFPSDLSTNKKLVGQHFTVLSKFIEEPSGERWVQPPNATDHHLDFISLVGTRDNKTHGLMMLTRDVQEHEINRHDHGENTIIITLLRAVGWLGRPEGGAGPSLETPGAQCQGMHNFDLSIIPFKPIAKAGKKHSIPGSLFRDIEAFKVPLQCTALHSFNDYHNTAPFPAIIDYRRFDLPHIHVVPENNAKFLDKPKILLPGTDLLSIEPPGIVMSAFKVAERDISLILRMYNPTRESLDCLIKLSPLLNIKQVLEVKLDEITPARCHEISSDGNAVSIKSFSHGEIVTLKLSR